MQDFPVDSLLFPNIKWMFRNGDLECNSVLWKREGSLFLYSLSTSVHIFLFSRSLGKGTDSSLLSISLCSSQSVFNFSFIRVSVVKVKMQETLHLIPVLGPRTTVCVLRWAFTRIFCFALQFQNEADLVNTGFSQTLVPTLPECTKLFPRPLVSASLQGL